MTLSVRGSISSLVFAVGLPIAASDTLAGTQLNRSLEPAATVRFGDVNTSTAQGIRVLYGRIGAAAGAVCAGVDWHPRQYWAQQECYRATVDHVVAKLNLPALTAAHLAATHRGPLPRPAFRRGIVSRLPNGNRGTGGALRNAACRSQKTIN
jgi:UrcA family protein